MYLSPSWSAQSVLEHDTDCLDQQITWCLRLSLFWIAALCGHMLKIDQIFHPRWNISFKGTWESRWDMFSSSLLYSDEWVWHLVRGWPLMVPEGTVDGESLRSWMTSNALRLHKAHSAQGWRKCWMNRWKNCLWITSRPLLEDCSQQQECLHCNLKLNSSACT